MSRVYSYTRFSAAAQADGASIARQTEYARKWAESHNLILDESLSMRDEGLSAYHQHHIKSGALGVFLAAITAGKIPTGSTLIVESLDRLSRTDPIDAQAQLTQIINGGVTVVTAVDGKQYNRATLKANPMDIIYSVLVMIRANEESETKSKRVSDALLRNAKAWQEGKRVTVPGGRVPGWVTRGPDGNYILIPENAAAMREAIRLYLAGYGAVRILDELKKQGLPPIYKDAPNNLDALFRNKSYLFLGNREMTISGFEFTLTGYYPALIDADTYNRLESETKKRKQRPHAGAGKGEVPNLFSGMGICRCGACGGLIVSNSRKMTAPRGEYWYRRLRCPTCERKADPSIARAPLSERYGKAHGSCATDHLEKAIFDFCSDQFNIASLREGDDNGSGIQKEQRTVVADLERDEKQLAKIVKLSLEGDGDIPAVLVRQMQEIETRIANNRERERHLSIELKEMQTTKPADAETWRALREGFFAFDLAARTAARKLFADTFASIVVHFAGLDANTPGRLDIVLTSKTGVVRRLTVDRKSGELVGMQRDGMHAKMIEDTAGYAVAKVSILH